METLRSRLGSYDAGLLLDVAVGRGEFLKFALQSFKTFVGAAGIDVSADMLFIAKEALGHLPVTLVTGSALSMPFPDHAFDTVTMSNSLHHMEDLDQLFVEMMRVCRVNGLIVINEMVSDEYSSLQENHMLYHNLIAEIDKQMGHYHRNIYSKKELLGIIREKDFKILERFMHEEKAGDLIRQEDVDQLVQSLSRRIDMLHNTDHYYFYENKARDIIDRLKKQGFHKPKPLTVVLRTPEKVNR